MWLLILLTVTYALSHWLLSLIVDGWAEKLVVFLVYMAFTEYLHRTGCLFVPGARSSWFARCLRRYVPQDYTRNAMWQLDSMARCKRQLMFCLAPHGPLCFGMVFGFAGHCKELPDAISDRLLIVGHWSIRLIPFARELSSLFGIISSSRTPIDEAIESRHHLALIPCGMQSKIQTLIEEPSAPNTIVVHRERRRMGFLSLAARHHMLVVPVLVPEENCLYQLHGTSLRLWPLTLALGRYIFLPRCAFSLRFGEPIDPDKLGGDIERLETAYYSALEKLAAPTHRIEFRYIG